MTLPTILIVEDNVAEQLVLRQLVARFDYESYVVASGEEALIAIQDHDFAAVILDVTLPGMDGNEFTRRVRQSEAGARQHMPIIAVTARSTQSDKRHCLAAGMDDFLSKPYDPESLRKILLRWVYQSSRPNLKLLQGYDQSYSD